NITDTAFTVTWVSTNKYVGTIYAKEGKDWQVWQPQQTGEIFYDDRDVELNEIGEYTQVPEGVKERYTHHVTVRNLKPETDYSIRVGGGLIGKEIHPEVRTGQLVEELNTPDPGYGSV